LAWLSSYRDRAADGNDKPCLVKSKLPPSPMAIMSATLTRSRTSDMESRTLVISRRTLQLFTDLDGARFARESVAAAGSLAAVDDAGVAKLAENGVEKLFWNVVRAGDIARLRRHPGRKAREVAESLQAVFSFGGEHPARWRLRSIVY
jgi:hypothetical protein